MPDNFKRLRLKFRSFFKAFFCILSISLLFCNTGFSNTPQQRQLLRSGSTKSKNSNYVKESIDSAIQEVASSIYSISNQSSISKLDSLHLRELSSRLTFLSGLAGNMESGDTSNEGNIQQDKLSIAILIFGLLIASTILVFQMKERKGINYMTFKLLGVIFIGTVSVFLIPAGFDNNQITPIVGLLGTLAGYLIGTSKSTTQENPGNKDTTAPQ
jgi:hypothetical protein